MGQVHVFLVIQNINTWLTSEQDDIYIYKLEATAYPNNKYVCDNW